MVPVTTITDPVPHPENLPCVECGMPATHARQIVVRLGPAMIPCCIGWCAHHAPNNAEPSNGVMVVDGRRMGELRVRGNG